MAEKFGQHFLSSPGILDRIAKRICGADAPRVLEIGPGRGALTEKLLACSSHLTAIEIDPELVAYLRSRFAASPGFELINANALDADFSSFHPDIVAGNLPYYVATPLITKTVRLGLPGVFLIQKEVAQRLAAGPGSRDYGFLSVETQLFADPEIAFSVSPGAFRPPPKVDSAVVVLHPRARAGELEIRDPDAFLRFLSASFHQKRKTLRNNLRSGYPQIEDQPEGKLRAEQLSLPQFAGLWQRLSKAPPHS